jgi:HAD superfamily hydrolase (TIGR01509 family)
MSCLSAVVFDFDGVVLDSETAEFEAHRLIFERYGATLTPDEWCRQVGIWTEGYEGRWFERLCGLSDCAPDQASYEAERRRIFQALVAREPMRGVRELLVELGAAGVPLAIASSSPGEYVWRKTTELGLVAHFGAIVSGTDVTRRKPAPDIYLEAARRLGAEPGRSVAVEDSAPGVTAARAAGMKVVAIPHWLTAGHDLAGADLRVGHADELTVRILERLVAQ